MKKKKRITHEKREAFPLVRDREFPEDAAHFWVSLWPLLISGSVGLAYIEASDTLVLHFMDDPAKPPRTVSVSVPNEVRTHGAWANGEAMGPEAARVCLALVMARTAAERMLVQIGAAEPEEFGEVIPLPPEDEVPS